MTAAPAARRLVKGSALAVLACLAGCAAEPKPAPVAPPPAAAPPPLVTMAPIANPEAPEAVHRETPVARSRSEEGVAARHAPARPPAAAAPSPGSGPAARVDPAAAAKLRARGLEELNRGAVAKAVALLSQASRLDPANAVIRRDLERAERIDRAVHGPH